MRAIIAYMRKQGLSSKKLVLLPPPPINEKTFGSQNAEKSNNLTRSYYDACHQLAHELEIDILDFWDDLQHPSMFVDLLHFSSAGSKVVFR